MLPDCPSKLHPSAVSLNPVTHVHIAIPLAVGIRWRNFDTNAILLHTEMFPQFANSVRIWLGHEHFDSNTERTPPKTGVYCLSNSVFGASNHPLGSKSRIGEAF